MLPMWYRLDENKKPVPCSLEEGAKLLGSKDRQVALTGVGNSEVSTVFLVLNQRLNGKVPVLFETLVFGGPMGGYMKRYTTWHAALSGHDQVVEEVRAAYKE